MKHLSLIIITFLFIGCGGIGTRLGKVRLTNRQPEVFTSNSLKGLLQRTQKPSIVLRIPVETSKATTETRFPLSTVYNAIEKELLKGGFTVRDRVLFNELLAKSQTNDYSKIKELTNTDLILEVVDFNTSVEYLTNKYYTTSKRGKIKESTLERGQIKLYGASTEFKVIIVNSNEISGNYKFNYTPCSSALDNCEYIIDDNGKLYINTASGKNKKVVQPYEFIESSFMENFMAQSTRDLINQLKN